MAEAEPADGLGSDVERLKRQAAKSDAQVRSLARALKRLTDQVSAATPDSGQAQEEPAAAGLASWLMTTTFPEADTMMTALTAWLAAVYLRYPDSELPTCWAWHPDVVEELWWLCNAWLDAYTGAKASWQKVGDWHDRQRPNVVARLRGSSRGAPDRRPSAASRCHLGKHVDRAGEPAPAAPMPDLLPHVLAAWCSPDRAQWPPTPTPAQLAEAKRHQAAVAASKSVQGR